MGWGKDRFALIVRQNGASFFAQIYHSGGRITHKYTIYLLKIPFLHLLIYARERKISTKTYCPLPFRSNIIRSCHTPATALPDRRKSLARRPVSTPKTPTECTPRAIYLFRREQRHPKVYIFAPVNSLLHRTHFDVRLEKHNSK